jgi:hypothetical protein
LNSGMCSEVFQINISAASAKFGSIIPAVSSTRIFLVLLDHICNFGVTLNCISRSLTLLNWQGGKSTLENCQILQVHYIYSAMQLRIFWR